MNLLLLALALCLQAKEGLSSQDAKAAGELVKKLFEAKTLPEKDAVLKDLEAYDKISKNDVGTFSRQCFTLMRKGPIQDGKSPATCTDPAHPGKYIISVPSAARKGAKTGLFISLHGGGAGVGDGGQIQGLFGTPAGNLICIYPTVTEKTDTAWNTDREDQYVMSIIEELKRTFNIDTNRIYLAGHSMGGFGTWSIGGHHADLFAALSPMAGGVYQPGCIENLKNTPIWFYHSTDDAQVGPDSDVKASKRIEELKQKYGPYDYVWKLYNDIGHGLPKDGVKPIFEWMLKKVRNPYPKHVIWQPQRAYIRNFYWLRSEGGRGGLIEAKIDGQTITVSTKGIAIYLNEKMVDLKKPVIVKVGDEEVFHGLVPYSLVAVADSIEAKMDPEMWFSARIVLTR